MRPWPCPCSRFGPARSALQNRLQSHDFAETSPRRSTKHFVATQFCSSSVAQMASSCCLASYLETFASFVDRVADLLDHRMRLWPSWMLFTTDLFSAHPGLDWRLCLPVLSTTSSDFGKNSALIAISNSNFHWAFVHFEIADCLASDPTCICSRDSSCFSQSRYSSSETLDWAAIGRWVLHLLIDFHSLLGREGWWIWNSRTFLDEAAHSLL